MRTVPKMSLPDDPSVSTAEQFGAAIRAARCAANLTLADAATALGMAKQTLANLETAKRGVSLETALRAAHSFGLTVLAVPTTQQEAVRKAVSKARDNDQPGSGPLPTRKARTP